jgi:hypothetical protein
MYISKRRLANKVKDLRLMHSHVHSNKEVVGPHTVRHIPLPLIGLSSLFAKGRSPRTLALIDLHDALAREIDDTIERVSTSAFPTYEEYTFPTFS